MDITLKAKFWKNVFPEETHLEVIHQESIKNPAQPEPKKTSYNEEQSKGYRKEWDVGFAMYIDFDESHPYQRKEKKPPKPNKPFL